MGFKLKLILSYLVVIAVSFAFIAFFLDKHLEDNSLHSIQSSLVTQAQLIEPQIAPDAIKKEDITTLETLVNTLSLKTKCRITIINTKGKVLADSEKPLKAIPEMENHLTRPEVKVALSGNLGIDTRYSPILGINMLYVAIPLKENTEILGTLRLALPLVSIEKTLSSIRSIVFTGLLLALLVAFIIGSLLATQTIRPINRMIQVSRKYSEGDFSRRIIANSKDEIGQLGSTLNKMAEDIEDKIREIRTQNQKLGAIFNSMIEGIIVVDKDSRIVSINPTIGKIFSTSSEEATGKMFLEAIRNNEIYDIINDVVKKGKSLTGEVNILLPVRKSLEINAAPILDGLASLTASKNTVTGCLVVIHDITEIRRLETIRSDFVANVSHELKTPLTSITGFVETLLEGALDDKENSRTFLKIIQSHAERLNKLVNDLLSLSYLESKKAALDKKSFDLKRQMDEIVSSFKTQLKKKNIELKNDLKQGFFITADMDKTDQVFTNLIDNAIKFNREKGLIRIYGTEANNQVKVTVEDSGVGIPEKDVSRIFERFYRVDKARSRELGGTGLGLSIVKHIVELHKGSVGVESAEGHGSKFWITLPKA